MFNTTPPKFTVKFGGAIYDELVNLRPEFAERRPDYGNLSAEHWLIDAPYDPDMLTEEAIALLKKTGLRDILYVTCQRKNDLPDNVSRAYNLGPIITETHSQPWPHINALSDVLDCTDHINRIAARPGVGENPPLWREN